MNLHDLKGGADLPVVERSLSFRDRLFGYPAFRKLLVIVVLGVAWELYATRLNNDLIFPALTDVLYAIFRDLTQGELTRRMLTTLETLFYGYSAGLACATILTVIAALSKVGTEVLETLTAMFNPLPAIALLPLALLWFGLGTQSMVFVVAHSVVWAIALSAHTGFRSVSETLRMVGRNYGLRGFSFVFLILVPAAFPSILSGLKIGWAFAWRTLIAAELVFGVSTRSGGLGWFIFENRSLLNTDSVFAGILMVMAIGLLVDNVFFRVVEARTVRRWGMQH